MSLTSRLGRSHLPASISEVDCDDIDSPICYSTPNIAISSKCSVPVPVKDFKQSLENEKNLRKYLTSAGTIQFSGGMGDEKIMESIEKNYRLQVQTLLEEVNQLKLDKKIYEKKLEKLQKVPASSPKLAVKSRTDLGSEPSSSDDLILKRTIESKNSTISELEFQLSQIKKENSNLKIRLEAQGKQMQEFVQRIADAENVKEMLEEKEDEIAELKASLEAEESKNERIQRELSNLRNENITLKLKSQCGNCGQPATGATSFANAHWSYNSKDLSFFSSEKNGHHHRTSSDVKPDKILNLSELNDDPKMLGSPSQGYAKARTMVLSSRTKDSGDEEVLKPKSEFSNLQNFSVKMLSEYEEGLKKEKSTDVKKGSKTLERIIEVNKIKSYLIEAQNKKLLSMLTSNKDEKVPIQKNV